MYLLVILITSLIFIIINNLLKKYNEYFDSASYASNTVDNDINDKWRKFCGVKKKSTYWNPKIKSYTNIDGETVELSGCAKENEKCILASDGQNTCCGDLKCVRLKNNYGYKVCSYEKDACGYFRNDYLKYIFDDELWNKIYDKLKSLFERNYTVDEEDSEILKNKRKEILDFIKIRGLCGERYSTQDIKKKLDEFFTKDQIFSGLIYGIKKVAQKEDQENRNSDRDCRNINGTLDNY